MKTKNMLLCILFFTIGWSNIFAQESDPAVKRAQNIYIELGGQGLTFTANYDSRFTTNK